MNLVAGIGKEVYGDGAHATGGAGDQDRTIGQPAQRINAQGSSVAQSSRAGHDKQSKPVAVRDGRAQIPDLNMGECVSPRCVWLLETG